MTESYYKAWNNKEKSDELVSRAVNDYINFLRKKTPTRKPIHTFSLNKRESGIKQLAEAYRELDEESPNAAKNFIASLTRFYNSSALRTPPDLFGCAIVGGALLSCADEASMPNFSGHLKILRPFASSESTLEKNLYFGALLRVADIYRKATGALQNSALSSLKKEWDFQVNSNIPSASLARTLTSAQSDDWPEYLCDCLNALPRSIDLATDDAHIFIRATQNIMQEVDASTFAQNLWKIGPFIEEAPTRGDILALALFGRGNSSLDDDLANSAPFKLIPPNTDEPAISLSQYYVSKNNSSKTAKKYKICSTPENPRNMHEFNTVEYNLLNFLLFVAVSVIAELPIAA